MLPPRDDRNEGPCSSIGAFSPGNPLGQEDVPMRDAEEAEPAEEGGSPGDRSVKKCGLTPRSYQREIYEVALRRNTIAMLETGAGKTLISLMLINRFGQQIDAAGKKPLMVFLAPTVNLVNQQFKQISDHTKFAVAEYYGAKGVDEWSIDVWQKEISAHHIMVMTPQILLDALRMTFIAWSTIDFVIFDECHRATGNHPYTRIMKEFYHTSLHKPRVFGMTASPVTRKGISSISDCEHQIDGLESLLDSKLYIVADRTGLERFVCSAKEINIYYDPSHHIHGNIREKLDSFCLKFDTFSEFWMKSPSNQFKDSETVLNSYKKQVSHFHGKIMSCLNDLGPFCALEAIKVSMERGFASSDDEYSFSRDILRHCNAFLEEALHAIEEVLPHDYELLLKEENGCSKATRMGYISPKLSKLIEYFQSLGTSRQALCLIFVERKITAKVIQRFVKNISCLSHLQVCYITGCSSSADSSSVKMQKDTLQLFHSGKINLLFTTDVAEEGLDVPKCSCVIRFDLPKTVRSYVQSRGRARQCDSQFVIMIERGNIQQRDLLFDIIRSEQTMIDTSLKSDLDASVSSFVCKEEKNVYAVESTGATITAVASVSLIQRYCEKLPRDKYFNPRPKFLVTFCCDGSYKCSLNLPTNAAFKTLVGPSSRSSQLAKQLVCLEACKKLHEMGCLNDYLLPFHETVLEVEETDKNKAFISGAGTTKRKELHGTAAIHAFSGTWAHETVGVTLQAYTVNFVCDQSGIFYSPFVLLIDTKLDDDIGNSELILYLVKKKVKCSVSSWREVLLDLEKLRKAKIFQEFFFNGLFGKLFKGSKSSVTKREFLFNLDRKALWKSSYMYLLLPLSNNNDPTSLCCEINWEAVDSCVYVVDIMKGIYSYNNCLSSFSEVCNAVFSRAELDNPDHGETESINLANKLVKFTDIKDIVVLSIHTGKIYSIIDVVANTSADSPFEGSSDSTYSDYFNKKYGIVLQHPRQPLLLLKHSHNPHNLLSLNIMHEGGIKNNEVMEKPLNLVHMPPELLIHVDVPIWVLKSFYLLPSLMHRLESLMLSSQLRHKIDSSLSLHIPNYLILEALTTLRCCEDFSMERLELLGDSVLKFAVSCNLFLKYPEKHEGQLSNSRSLTVCNAALHKLGTDHNLQNYIRDAAFEPRRWLAPGQASLHPVDCHCGDNTTVVPLKVKYKCEEKVVIGKACDLGHRWMCSKTIADCVEALIGACFVGAGMTVAISFISWLGIDVGYDLSFVEQAIQVASLRDYVPKLSGIKELESKLNYSFSVRGLLLEAITHASHDDAVAFCYQRLEFLGDAVLDLLITNHHFKCYDKTDPGELTDLRSASVNNDTFAQISVKRKLHHHLQHGSALLSEQITEYATSIEQWLKQDIGRPSFQGKVPKVLGDIVESIAAAIFIDTRLNLDKVWQIFEPLLSPIVTPDSLELPPFRELTEMCNQGGYFVTKICVSEGEIVVAKLQVQLEDALLVAKGLGKTSKSARAQASATLLSKLKERGLPFSRQQSKRKQPDSGLVDGCCSVISSDNCKKQSICNLDDSPPLSISYPKDYSVPLSVKMTKGGPRTALYELCKKLQWPMPTFESTEVESFINGSELSEKKNGTKKFRSKIVLCIPNSSTIELMGDDHSDKKTSCDSAARAMLDRLETLGRCCITEI